MKHSTPIEGCGVAVLLCQNLHTNGLVDTGRMDLDPVAVNTHVVQELCPYTQGVRLFSSRTCPKPCILVWLMGTIDVSTWMR